MTATESEATRRLRSQVESALASGRSRKVVQPLLERLLRAAAPGTDTAVFAHRRLAEVLLAHHPWRALLHLRQVTIARPLDDGAHAMAGLAHAMCGHYRAAVAAYRRAVRLAPDNPWYQHNLGHLLDAALERPALALPHLRAACAALGDDEPEVANSLAACLARLGQAAASPTSEPSHPAPAPNQHRVDGRRNPAWPRKASASREPPATKPTSTRSDRAESPVTLVREQKSPREEGTRSCRRRRSPSRPPARGRRDQ